MHTDERTNQRTPKEKNDLQTNQAFVWIIVLQQKHPTNGAVNGVVKRQVHQISTHGQKLISNRLIAQCICMTVQLLESQQQQQRKFLNIDRTFIEWYRSFI